MIPHINRIGLWLGLCLCWGLTTYAQTPFLHIDFEEGASLWEKNTPPDSVRLKSELQQPQFVSGLKGQALDLSSQAALRQPLILEDSLSLEYDAQQSFSVLCWVKTLPGAHQGTPIVGNKKASTPNARGWQIYTQENGAWAVNLSDSVHTFAYEPTARQRINDGQWHLIGFSVHRPQQKVTFYRDGKAVAIYNVPELKGLDSPLHTVIGGSEEYFEWGSYGQWTSFNGYLEEVSFYKRPLKAAEVKREFETYFPPTASASMHPPEQLKIMAWNIWHGGHRYGQHVGLERVINIMKKSQADILCLQETYGSGAIIADSLGYYFYLISSNLSIMSRFPIVETPDVYKPFNSGGALLQVSPDQFIRVFCIWLHYLPSYGKHVSEQSHTAAQLIEEEGKTRHAEIRQILTEIQPQLSEADRIPVLMAGDFNSGSHLDWTEDTKGLHFGYQVEWPVSKRMEEAGMVDSYRHIRIDPLRDPGFTWTPRAATSSTVYGLRDRIDYIYYQGKQLGVIASEVVDYHPVQFPSDHAAVVTTFRLTTP